MAKLRDVVMSVPDPAAAAKFWVDDLDEQSERISRSGGSFFRELPLERESLHYEMKFRDPNGIIFDISHNGWVGAEK